MAFDLIDLGTAPKGVDGDTQRTANEKTNSNFGQADTRLQSLENKSLAVSFRNKLINPDFSIAQRGIAYGGPGYLIDRWIGQTSGGTSIIQTQFTPSPIIVQGSYATINVTSGATAPCCAVYTQRIEGVRSLAGGPVTVTFYGSAALAGAKIGVELLQHFGSGGSPSAVVSTNLGVITIGASNTDQATSISGVLPSVVGKTIGTNGDDRLELNFWLDSGASNSARSGFTAYQSGIFRFFFVQCEAGSVATPFEIRPPAIEQSLCYRYCQPSRLFSTGRWNNSTACRIYFDFIVPMRAAPGATLRTNSFSIEEPSVVIHNTTNGSFGGFSGDTNRGFGTFSGTFSNNVTTGAMAQVNTGSLVLFDAEL